MFTGPGVASEHKPHTAETRKKIGAGNKASRFITTAVNDVPQLSRGRVWCISCGAIRKVDSSQCLSMGWPKCCGSTMTIDSPEERKRMEAAS